MLRLSSLTGLQFSQLARYGALLLINICFAQLAVPQNSIGYFETFLLVSGMLSFFWVSGLINSMLSVYAKKNEEQKKVVLFNTFISLLGFSLIALLVLFFFSGIIMAFLPKQETQLLLLSTLYILFLNPSFIAEYILFLNGRKKELFSYSTFIAILTTVAGLAPVIAGYPLVYSIYGLIGVAIVRLLITFILLFRFASFQFNSSLLLEHLKLATPVILSIFVSGSAEYIDGIIIKWKFDDATFAIYRYGAKELPILLIVANTFSSGMIPALAANLDKGLEEIKQRSARLMHFLFPLTIGLMLVSPWLYGVVFNEGFAYSAVIFNIYLLLIIPRLVFPQTILTGIQQTRFLLISSILEITINVSLSIYLAGILGLPGVAIGTFVAYCIDKLFLMGVAHFYFNISPSRYLKIMPYLVYVALTIVSFGVGYVILGIP